MLLVAKHSWSRKFGSQLQVGLQYSLWTQPDLLSFFLQNLCDLCSLLLKCSIILGAQENELIIGWICNGRVFLEI